MILIISIIGFLGRAVTPQDAYWYDMDAAGMWEVSEVLERQLQSYQAYLHMYRWMEANAWPLHMGKINRGDFADPGAVQAKNRDFGVGADFNDGDLDNSLAKKRPDPCSSSPCTVDETCKPLADGYFQCVDTDSLTQGVCPSNDNAPCGEGFRCMSSGGCCLDYYEMTAGFENSDASAFPSAYIHPLIVPTRLFDFTYDDECPYLWSRRMSESLEDFEGVVMGFNEGISATSAISWPLEYQCGVGGVTVADQSSTGDAYFKVEFEGSTDGSDTYLEYAYTIVLDISYTADEEDFATDENLYLYTQKFDCETSSALESSATLAWLFDDLPSGGTGYYLYGCWYPSANRMVQFGNEGFYGVDDYINIPTNLARCDYKLLQPGYCACMLDFLED